MDTFCADGVPFDYFEMMDCQCHSDTGLSYPTIRKWWDSALTAIEEIDSENRYSVLAGQLKQTLMRYARKEKKKGDDRAAITLYGY